VFDDLIVFIADIDIFVADLLPSKNVLLIVVEVALAVTLFDVRKGLVEAEFLSCEAVPAHKTLANVVSEADLGADYLWRRSILLRILEMVYFYFIDDCSLSIGWVRLLYFVGNGVRMVFFEFRSLFSGQESIGS
jgi:hypothetical protein